MICPPAPGVASALGAAGRAGAGRSGGDGRAPARPGELASWRPLSPARGARRTRDRRDRAVAGKRRAIERLGRRPLRRPGLRPRRGLPPRPYEEGDSARGALQAAFARGYRREIRAARRPKCRSSSSTSACRCAAPVPGGEVAGLAGGGSAEAARQGHAACLFRRSRRLRSRRVYDRDRLAAGATFRGPALVEEPGSTLVIGPAGTAEVMASGSIVVTLE